MTLRRAAIYCRVSSTTQDTSDPWASLPRQEEALRGLAQRDGVGVAVVYHEVYTGVSTQRPDFNDLLQRCRAGELQAIYVASFDRLTRAGSMGELEQLRHELIHLGVDLVSPSQVWRFSDPDQDTPEAALTFNLMGAVVGYDRGKIVQRMAQGRERKAKSGGDYGAPCPYGYRPVFDHLTGTKAFEVVPEEAEVVREIFRRYLAGEGFKRIASELNAREVPAPGRGRWNARHVKLVAAGGEADSAVAERIARALEAGEEPKSIAAGLNADGIINPSTSRWGNFTVQYITENAAYAGITEFLKPRSRKARRIKSRTPTTLAPSAVYAPIIDVETMQRARAAREVRADDPKQEVTDLHPLSGLLRCGRCNGRCQSVGRKARASGQGGLNYYECRGKRDARSTCPRPARFPMELAHEKVLEFLQRHLKVDAPARRRKQAQPAEARERQDIARQIAALEQEETTLVRHLGQGLLTPEAYRRASQQLAGELERLRQRLTMMELGERKARSEAERQADKATIASVIQHFKADDPQLRGLFARTIKEVRLEDLGRDPKDRRYKLLRVVSLTLRTGEVLAE